MLRRRSSSIVTIPGGPWDALRDRTPCVAGSRTVHMAIGTTPGSVEVMVEVDHHRTFGVFMTSPDHDHDRATQKSQKAVFESAAGQGGAAMDWPLFESAARLAHAHSSTAAAIDGAEIKVGPPRVATVSRARQQRSVRRMVATAGRQMSDAETETRPVAPWLEA